MHLSGCIVVVTGYTSSFYLFGVLLQSFISTSKVISEFSGIGSPPTGA